MLFVLGAILLPASTTTHAQAISKACPRPTAQQPPDQICCISGYVFFDGAIVDGAEIVIYAENGKSVSTKTTTDEQHADLPPAYGIDLAEWFEVDSGDVITVMASYRGHSWSVTHVVREGPQWVNLSRAPSDYDLDGKTDIAVFRPSNRNWYTLRSADGVMAVNQFGHADDIPVPGDYDGDGKTDVAVFSPGTGHWYVLLSSTGTALEQTLGAAGDIPIPTAYLSQ